MFRPDAKSRASVVNSPIETTNAPVAPCAAITPKKLTNNTYANLGGPPLFALDKKRLSTLARSDVDAAIRALLCNGNRIAFSLEISAHQLLEVLPGKLPDRSDGFP